MDRSGLLHPSAGPRRRRLALLAGLACALAAASAAPAAAYEFGPGVTAGPETVVFDWTTQKCESNDIPDQAAKAYRNAAGQVVLIDTHFTVRRYVGPTLGSVAHSCAIAMTSHNNRDPSMFDEKEWIGTTWTEDGNTVHGLIHSEFQGYNHPPGYCLRPGEPFSDKQKCWYNTLTLAKSTNGGATFTHGTPPTHFVAGPSYRYEAGIGPIGYFQPSNIVRARDGYLYILSHVEDYGVQPVGSCPMRTNDIDDPRSWRLWDGSGFNRRSVDPYRTSPLNPADHVCVPGSSHIGTMSESLTWSTYFKKWMLVGGWQGIGGPSYPDSGFYYFLSDDLVRWTPARLIMKGKLPWAYQCSDGREQVRDPSVLDPDSESRNFDSAGQRAYLFFTRFHVSSSCTTSLDRDLIRIPIKFSNQEPGGPSVTLSASDTTPAVGAGVNFTASATDSDGGRITAYKWDLDGDGSFERDTGTTPTTSRQYSANEKLTVTVRACDDSGKGTDETLVLDVGSAPIEEPPPQRGVNSTGGVCQTDFTAPETTINSKPPSPSSSASATFTFSASEAADFTCTLDGGQAKPCSSPLTYSSLADGQHTFTVRATDRAGNADPTPATHTWTVDTAAPETTINSKPPSPSSSASATFTFSAGEAADFTCTLDGGQAAPCSSPLTYSSLADGQHTFTVRATDRAGNADPTPATHTWTVDTTAPETTINSKPPVHSSSASATFTFSAGEAADFTCSLDGAAPAPCGSPATYQGLADGQHTFTVRATDRAGNADPTPATHTWTVDTIAPETTIGSGPPAATSATGASFTFSAGEAADFTCSLDGAAPAPCGSPATYLGLADGQHTFTVRATDRAGNADPTPATHTWTVDATPPETGIDSASTTGTEARFSFSSSEPADFSCALDGGPPQPCTSPVAYADLAPGGHKFEVWATDRVGNADPTPATRTWQVEGPDTTPPDTVIRSAVIEGATARFTFTAGEEADFSCSLDGAAPAACESPVEYTDLAPGDHTFSVFATDRALNADPTPATHAWTIAAADPAGGGDLPPPAPPAPAAPPAAAAPAAAPPAAKPSGGRKRARRIGRVRLVGKPRPRSGGRILVRVRVPAAGTLVVRGAGKRAQIRRARRKATRAGTLRVLLRPTAAGLKALRERRKARARVTLVFTPRAGKPQRSTRTLTISRARPR